jgi:DNA polymerase-3 subunit delta
MKYLEFCNTLKSGALRPVYFFSGEEAGLIDEAVHLLLEKLVTAETRDFNHDVFYAGEVGARRILDVAASYPMMASHRTVLVRDLQKMPASDLNALVAYAKKPCPTTYLILTQREKASGKKALDALQRAGAYVECKPLYDNQVVPWIQSYVLRLGREITPEAAHWLATEVGNSIHALRSELEKTFIYIGAQRRIALEHVQEVAGARREFSVFSLQDAIGERNLVQALRIVDQLVTNANSGALISTMVRYFSHLYVAKALPRRQDLAQLSEKTGVHSFFAERLQKAASQYDQAAILNAFEVLHQADYLVKSQNISQNLLMRLVIIAIIKSLPARYLPFPRQAQQQN